MQVCQVMLSNTSLAETLLQNSGLIRLEPELLDRTQGTQGCRDGAERLCRPGASYDLKPALAGVMGRSTPENATAMRLIALSALERPMRARLCRIAKHGSFDY